MPFANTHPTLAKALEARGYIEPTPVQAAVNDAPEGSDLLVSAQTGSGNTVAFGLAAAHSLLGDAERFGQGAAPLALIIAPTRELAIQVSRELEWLYAPTGAQVVTCVGGMDARREQRALYAGCHIVVGTPGRLRDHLERGNLDLSALKVVVLDEADEMLDLGFREELEAILDSTPTDRRTLLLSATIAPPIASLARRYQRDAIRIDTIQRNEPHGDIDYRAIRMAPTEMENVVVNLLRFYEAPGALIFCSTREAVRHLHSVLRERGFAVVALSGELSQKERADALQALRDGHARACVATDVAARGLDLPDLGLVIHAQMPQNKAALLHRSGRTGRAGKKGISILLVPYTQRRKAEQLLDSAHVDVTWGPPPTIEEIKAQDQARMFDDPLLKEPPSEDELVLATKMLAERTPEAIAAALIRLYRSRLPEPEDVIVDPRDNRPMEPRDARARPERRNEPNLEMAGASWFRLGVGRKNSADPKWLIPLICRAGHVTKKDIGQIRIFDRETKFEIAADAEPRFREAIKAEVVEGGMRIEPAGAPGPAGPKREREREPERSEERSVFKPKPPKPAYDPNRPKPAFDADRPKKAYDPSRGKPAFKDGPKPPYDPSRPKPKKRKKSNAD
ncbi:DEAD/DEAH box helicase [soil metagenome]